MAKPLYACTGGNQSLTWTEIEQAFNKLKTALTTALALALPDISKPFQLFVHKKQGVTKGVLTQTLGPWSRPVTYLSKKLNPVAAIALLVKEVDKLTLGQELNLVAPHVVESLLRGAPGKWMSNVHIVQYQALLLDQPGIKFLKATVLNPAMLLPDSEPEEPIHDGQ
ncbi:Gag-Pol polyprotein [Plecturocebus cupreus]